MTADDWMSQAACYGLDPDLWFPERGQNYDTSTAKAICRAFRRGLD
jgi:hypothetical protein